MPSDIWKYIKPIDVVPDAKRLITDPDYRSKWEQRKRIDVNRGIVSAYTSGAASTKNNSTKMEPQSKNNSTKREQRKAMREKLRANNPNSLGLTTSEINMMGGAASALSTISGALNKNQTGTQQAVNSAVHQGLQAAGPKGMAISMAASVLDGIAGAAGITTDVVNSASADRAGFKGENTANELLSAIPGMSLITGGIGAALGKTTEASKSQYIDGMGIGYSASVQDINAAADMGGKNLLFGRNKADAFVRKANATNQLMTNIAMQSEMAKNNSSAQLYQQQNFNKYAGSTPRLLLSKKGGIIPELDSARVLLRKLDTHKVRGLNINALLADIDTLFNPDQKKNIVSTVSQLVADSKDGLSSKDISDLIKNQMLDVEKDPQAVGIKIVENIVSNKKELAKILKKNGVEQFIPILDNPNNVDNVKVLGEILSQISANKSYADGGEVTKYQLGGKITSNYIPEGALHRNKHHIEDVAPELEGQITEKGIPVVSDTDGEVTQHAEIEGLELTLSLPTSKKLEEYYKDYQENPSEELLIECGK